MGARASAIFATGAVGLIVGGFTSLTWKDAANNAYATIQHIAGQPNPEPLFTIWTSVLMVLSGFGLGFLAVKVK